VSEIAGREGTEVLILPKVATNIRRRTCEGKEAIVDLGMVRDIRRIQDAVIFQTPSKLSNLPLGVSVEPNVN